VRGITAYLENGSLLEHAQAMAGHVSARRMKLYDCRGEQVSLGEVERISLRRFKPSKGGLGSNWQDGSQVITNAGNCRGQ
jgi:hypothetical protein